MNRLARAFLLTCVLALPAAAQDNLPRVKGRIVDFDGLTFHLAPDKGPQLTIRLQSRTQFMTTQTLALADIKVGSYAGATVAQQDGGLIAEEVHLYPDAMRGSSEGRIALGGNRFVITGAVTAAGAGNLTLFYRGARADGGPRRLARRHPLDALASRGHALAARAREGDALDSVGGEPAPHVGVGGVVAGQDGAAARPPLLRAAASLPRREVLHGRPARHAAVVDPQRPTGVGLRSVGQAEG